ncbi:hypothetical protein C162_07739 [Paenibacillus sp. FSL R7-269]|nr:hypothetical protein C162_07739 [Paenibacillus sp. FSL R7-269]
MDHSWCRNELQKVQKKLKELQHEQLELVRHLTRQTIDEDTFKIKHSTHVECLVRLYREDKRKTQIENERNIQMTNGILKGINGLI